MHQATISTVNGHCYIRSNGCERMNNERPSTITRVVLHVGFKQLQVIDCLSWPSLSWNVKTRLQSFPCAMLPTVLAKRCGGTHMTSCWCGGGGGLADMLPIVLLSRSGRYCVLFQASVLILPQRATRTHTITYTCHVSLGVSSYWPWMSALNVGYS